MRRTEWTSSLSLMLKTERRLSRLSTILVVFLSLFLLVESFKPCRRLVKGASCLMCALKLDIKQFPTRNTPGLPRHSPSTTKASLPPSCKLKVSLHLLKLSVVASSLVLLSGDVSLNPGPYADDLPKARGFKVAHLNVRSLVNKLDDISHLVRSKSFDIFSVSETWLNPTILDTEIDIPGYTLVRHDRNGKRGGGTAIFVRDGIPYRHLTDLFDGVNEACWIEINRAKCKKLIVCCVYRPPDYCCDSLIDYFNTSLSKLPAETEVIILGDFNADFSAEKNTAAYKAKQKLQRFANLNDFEQLIKTPTRICNQTRTLIDLVFVNNSHRVVESGVIYSAISDHSIVYCTIKSGVPKAPPKTIEYRSYRTFDKNSFIQDLKSIDWDIIDETQDLDAAVETWNTLFSDVADKHAPIKRSRIKGTKTPWLTAKLKDAMRDRDYHHRKAIKSNSEFHWNMYKKLKCLVTKQVKKSKADYYLELINRNKSNSSGLWKILNEITSRKSTSPVTCIEADGVTYTDSQSIAEVLNDYFSSIGSKLAAKITPGLNYIWKNPSLTVDANPVSGFNFQPVEEAFVRTELNRLKTNKAIGLDKISARLLKDSASLIAPVLTKLFNRSLESSKFPSIWKFGKVTALFKSGDRCDSGNYRPITILPTVSKVLEKVVHHQVYKYLVDEKILSPVQFGFRPNLSTEVALIHFTDSILDNMDKGAVTGAVFLDLSKAFDTVNHSILFSKLSKAGLTDATITWFKSYLYQRIQVTRVDNATSSAKYVSVGVPQGSVLGPLLFILYVNDLPSCIKKCKVTMYADDTVLYFSSSTLSGLEENLNADLEILCRYLNDNLLTLNAEKSKFVIFGSTRKLNSFREFSLEINAHNLERRDTFKYLGIKLNQNMSWSDQIDALSKKVSQRLGVLRCVKYLLPLHGRLAIYNSLILPLFDYADIVWGDKNNKVLMHNLQVLQNNAARTILDYPKYFSGTEALAQLNWMPLSERRRQHRCIGIYKCINI